MAGMGVGNSRALDDGVRLSHTALVSALIGAQCPRVGQTRTSSLGPHVRFRRGQTLVREGSPLVKLRNSA
jgi:hypothetical protein